MPRYQIDQGPYDDRCAWMDRVLVLWKEDDATRSCEGHETGLMAFVRVFKQPLLYKNMAVRGSRDDVYMEVFLNGAVYGIGPDGSFLGVVVTDSSLTHIAACVLVENERNRALLRTIAAIGRFRHGLPVPEDVGAWDETEACLRDLTEAIRRPPTADR
jgi:hypothetical protein